MNETPYYYLGDGNRVAYHRVGNQSIPADARTLKGLVLRGSDSTYDREQGNFYHQNVLSIEI